MANVLLTSAGRRSYLVNYFKQALNGDGKVIAANIYNNTPAMIAADEAVLVPPSFDEDYIPSIISICNKYEVDLICSLHDLDVFILSKNLDQIIRETTALPVVPDATWARICLDKYECTSHLKEHGIAVPWADINLSTVVDSLEIGELSFPLILKARLGFGSLGLTLCHNIDELKYQYDSILQQINRTNVSQFFDHPMDQGILIQEHIDGKEYCIDIINDLQGNYVCHFACEVHAMRGGETDSVTTIDPAIAGNFPKKLSMLTRHPGIWGVDIIVNQGTQYVIDVNPRFTGDYPFQQICGANIPAALIAWKTGQKPDLAWFLPETDVTAFKDLVPTRIPARQQNNTDSY